MSDPGKTVFFVMQSGASFVSLSQSAVINVLLYCTISTFTLALVVSMVYTRWLIWIGVWSSSYSFLEFYTV
jgi:hypothetical protein